MITWHAAEHFLNSSPIHLRRGETRRVIVRSLSHPSRPNRICYRVALAADDRYALSRHATQRLTSLLPIAFRLVLCESATQSSSVHARSSRCLQLLVMSDWSFFVVYTQIPFIHKES